MANKKYNQFDAGTPAGTDPILYGDPTTGLLKKVTVEGLLEKKTIEVELSSAQILSLFATPILVIPGEAGKLPYIYKIVAIYRFGTVAYTGGGPVLLRATSGGVTIQSGVMATGSITSGADKITASTQLSPLTIAEGTGVELSNGNGALLNGDGTLKVIITYQMIDVT